MPKLLVVDDDLHIRELIRFYLADEGFEVAEAGNGEEAWRAIEAQTPDLVVLDIMMPKMDGWELCRRIRAYADIPILMITAKSETDHRIKGFRLGTDDYLTKPFDPTEMVLRVKALMKRYRIATSGQIALGDLILDRTTFQIVDRRMKSSLTLPLKEFELLYRLASYPGQVFTRSQLIDAIWGADYEGDERTVDVHIKRLRERFEAHESAFRIATLRGLGYRLEVSRD
ncbi:response regulator transcription factor [Paenibacillus cymbidii]|uniref:response regulator transcription factor n=1 Tax=Paenibacillus cymbidii TaxID=1639034 RepID=UPI0010821F53|nr:response regulator transcription factor [Paenibacillus cymbidii]